MNCIHLEHMYFSVVSQFKIVLNLFIFFRTNTRHNCINVTVPFVVVSSLSESITKSSQMPRSAKCWGRTKESVKSQPHTRNNIFFLSIHGVAHTFSHTLHAELLRFGFYGKSRSGQLNDISANTRLNRSR